ncbi:DUF983 domain-containing protein [Undibacter mobilis]|uniref:DUF983 domain-containing protein n=1 Tax=Undibacter mobilis TaxID=2292256 RepID=A0A371B8A6_9BRAD|nr:DUF983 domain-containing protein [Undibacter mobilis]RDV03757.1 DUF983 domain-containing protein [Undibacter mobilis]
MDDKIEKAGALPRSAFGALGRGFRGKCPACGKGRMFRAFLKVADTCPACGEELHHHRADDFPAYLVTVLTGFLLVPVVLAVEMNYTPPIWLSVSLWPAIAFVMAMTLLQPIKGTVVALQWYAGLHGFEAAKKARQAGGAS